LQLQIDGWAFDVTIEDVRIAELAWVLPFYEAAARPVAESWKNYRTKSSQFLSRNSNAGG
jgi:hypothetical protein